MRYLIGFRYFNPKTERSGPSAAAGEYDVLFQCGRPSRPPARKHRARGDVSHVWKMWRQRMAMGQASPKGREEFKGLWPDLVCFPASDRSTGQ